MRLEYILAIAAAAFLAYTYFHDASEVEHMFDRFVEMLAAGAIRK